MTHPLTPREKVAQIIKEKVSGPHFTDPSHFVAMEQDRFIAADAILTALASGSGDHAELARLAEAATPGEWELDGQQCLSVPDGTIVVDYSCCGRGEWEANAAYLRAVQPSRVLALLAEIAALRAGRDEEAKDARLIASACDKLRVLHRDEVQSLYSRATEAERKLAEAVGLLSELEQHVRSASEGRGHARAAVKSADAARAFLSKEAERG